MPKKRLKTKQDIVKHWQSVRKKTKLFWIAHESYLIESTIADNSIKSALGRVRYRERKNRGLHGHKYWKEALQQLRQLQRKKRGK